MAKGKPKSDRNSTRTRLDDERMEYNTNSRQKRSIELDEVYDMTFKIKNSIKFKNDKQKEMYDTILNNRITFVSGAAGTGKTLISLLAGLEVLKEEQYKIGKIILTKPIVEVSSNGKGLGSLPGSIEEKSMSYFTHFYDNLVKLVGEKTTGALKEHKKIKETLLNFVRGTTFGEYVNEEAMGDFCIFDEAQNCTVSEMKTFLSRMGERTKMVILGDIDQIDLRLRDGELCGLEDAIQRFTGENKLDGVGFIQFTEEHIVRDPFLIQIMKRYKGAR